LFVAIQQGHVAVVQCMIEELGANVNVLDSNGCTPFYIAALHGNVHGNLTLLRCLVKEHGVDVNQATHDGATPLYAAAQKGHEAVVRCLVKELGADVNQSACHGMTPLYAAAQAGQLAVVKCLVKELGADVNQVCEGITPLMGAAKFKHTEIVVWLIKHGADTQTSHQVEGTAADVSRDEGAPAEQTEYLEARTHCAKPGCDGAGLKKCAGCLTVFFCGPACIRAHWPAHKAECKLIAEAAAAGKVKC
jgi:ankyrin repeat protein